MKILKIKCNTDCTINWLDDLTIVVFKYHKTKKSYNLIKKKHKLYKTRYSILKSTD